MSPELISNVNLKLLQAFLMVADCGSFRVAAGRLNRSHSAISSQIAQLEAQLGVTLFIRTTRVVKLTPEGSQLTESARRALSDIGSAMQRIREAAHVRENRVAIACSSSMAQTHLPQILRDFIAWAPNVSIRVMEMTSIDLMQAMEDGKVDFAVGTYIEHKGLDSEIVLNESLLLVAPHALMDGRKEIEFSRLSELPFIFSVQATATRAIIEKESEKIGIKISGNYEFIQFHSIIAMCKAGIGAAILPDSIVRHFKLGEELHIGNIVGPALTRQIAIITNRDHPLAGSAKQLAARIRQHFAAQSAEADPCHRAGAFT